MRQQVRLIQPNLKAPRSGERSYRRLIRSKRKAPRSGERSYRRLIRSNLKAPRSGERSYRLLARPNHNGFRRFVPIGERRIILPFFTPTAFFEEFAKQGRSRVNIGSG